MTKNIKWVLLSIGLFIVVSCASMQNVMDSLADLDEGATTAAGSMNSETLLSDGCPRVDIVDELSAINEFTDPRRPVNANLISRVDLSRADSTCEYSRNSVTVDLKLVFDGFLGPRGRVRPQDKPFFSYPFFVAVVSPGGQILAKEVFAASMTYKEGQEEQVYYESLRQIIPVGGKRSGSRHKIMVGFQLSEDQLAFNRLLLERIQTMKVPQSNPENTPDTDNSGSAPVNLSPMTP